MPTQLQEYHSILPPRGLLQKMKLKDPDTSIDQYLHSLSGRKQKIIDELRELAK